MTKQTKHKNTDTEQHGETRHEIVETGHALSLHALSLQHATPMQPNLRFPEFTGDWEEKMLGDLGKLISGLTYNPNDVTDKGLLVLRSSNIKNGVIDLGDCVYVNPEIKGANISETNDILICVRNGSKTLIGKNALIPENIPFSTHGAFMTMFRSSSAKFIFQLFQTDLYNKQVAADLGATINSINNSHLKKYKFTVPKTLAEQQKIASCLSSLDARLEAETEKLQTLKTHKKGLLQNLFPQNGETSPNLRFPEFSGDWEEKKISDICDINPSSEKLPPEFVYIDLESVESGVLLKKSIISLNNAPSRAQRLLKYGDVIFQMVRPYQKNNLHFLLKDEFNYVASTGYAQLRAFQSDTYLFQLIHYQVFVDRVLAKSTGSNYPAINSNDLKEILVTVPKTLAEQQKIAACLSALDAVIAAQGEKIEHLKQHKKGLMQQLFPNPAS